MRSAFLAVAIAAALVVAVSPANAAETKHCAGVFRVTKQVGSATDSVAVHNLRATGTSCRRAMDVARIAATATLNHGIDSVPDKIDGYKLTISGSCSGCSPQYSVDGHKLDASVRFKLFGGG